MQSSSVSSNFITKLLNFENVSSTDNEIASLMDTIVRHEEPSGQTSTLFTVPITYAQAISSIPAIVDYYINNKLGEAIHKAIQSHNAECREEAQAEKQEYIDLVDTSRNVTESLEAYVLAKSSFQPKSTYEAAASLLEYELTKILLDKMEESKSHLRADYKRKLYDALVESYNTDKDLFETYGEVFTLKRSRDEKDKDQDPSAGTDRGTKKRKSSNHTIDDSGVQKNQEFDTGNNDEQPNDESAPKNNCVIARAEKPPTLFDELIDTPIDFSAFVMNQINITNLTQELLVGPAFNLLKGTCKSLTELEYHFEECSKATTKRLDWHNPEGKPYPFDLRGSLSRQYSTSVTKIMAATYETNGLKTWESMKDVYSIKRIIVVTSLKIIKWYDYGHLDEIKVRREDQQLYTFKEGNFPRLRLEDIEDMLLLLNIRVIPKSTHNDDGNPSSANIKQALRNRIDLSYTNWTRHGEKDEPSISAPKPVNATTKFVDDTDFASDIPTDGPTTVEMVNATKDNFDEDDLVKFQELLLDAEKPLYKGCPDFTKLSAIVKLLNLKGKYGASDKFFTELLGLIKKMLPAGNEMVEKTYQAKKVMKLMGSGYKKIHVCINNCLLYWKDDKDLTACQTCGISRWKVDNKTHKVYENIPAKASQCPGNDIDVFLEPLVDDLHTLFETGVDTYDVSTKDNFNLRVVVLWTINDYPALGTLCGCPYSGFKGCVQKKAFNGQQEFLPAPIPMTGEQIYNEVQHIENKWGKGKRTNNKASENQEDMRGRGGKIQKQKRNTTEEEGSSSQVNGQNDAYWKKFNIWYRKLRYWRHNSVPHCIDFMHVEKNVAESLVGTLLHVPGKTKDGVNARLDLAELGVKPELFAMQEEDKTTLPPAGYTLTNAEKDTFCETLHNIRVPQGYCSNFSSLVNLKDRKLIGLKSHDYHMLMQEFLPIAIRSIMHPPTRYAIIRFCFFFKSICSKEIILQELDKMQAELVVTLCLLEKFFPLSFFDIMIHLTVHLTREVKLCGPICFRWMYPFERCMKVIKGHVRNKNKPEGCIAEETIAEETIERHKQVFKTDYPGKQIAFLENEHSKSFAKWLRKEVERELAISKESVSETVRWISYGPRATVVKYDAYNINGYTFRTKCHDGKVYQNSGVSVEAIDLYISKEVATTRQAFYYGVLQEIWVLDYRFRQIPLFKCDWVNHRAGGVKRDNLGYTLVDLNNLGHKVDLFILASQARQVFYVKDQIDKKLSVVFKTPPKNYKDTYDEVGEEFSTVIHQRNDNILPCVNRRDLGNESRDDYYQTDCGGVVIRKSK
ncbi:putative transposase-associated domain-containing protein [Tanacetum coccineum]